MRFLIIFFLSGMLINAQVAKITLRVKVTGTTKEEMLKNANKKSHSKIYKYILKAFSAREREICEENSIAIVSEVKRFMVGQPEVLEQEITSVEKLSLLEGRYKLRIPFDVQGFKKWLRNFIVQKKEFPTVAIEIEENFEVLPEGLINPRDFRSTIEQMFIDAGFDVLREEENHPNGCLCMIDKDAEMLIAIGREFSADLKVKFDFKVSLKKRKIHSTETTVYEARCSINGNCIKVATNVPYATVSEYRKKISLDLEDAVYNAVLPTAKKAVKKLIRRIFRPRRIHHIGIIDVKISNIDHFSSIKLKNTLKENDRIKHIRQVSFSQKMVHFRIRANHDSDGLMETLAKIIKKELKMYYQVVLSKHNYIWLRLENGDEDDDEEKENDF